MEVSKYWVCSIYDIYDAVFLSRKRFSDYRQSLASLPSVLTAESLLTVTPRPDC